MQAFMRPGLRVIALLVSIHQEKEIWQKEEGLYCGEGS